MTEYCCNMFQRAVDYDDFAYYKAKEDSYRAITKDGWYIRDAQYDKTYSLARTIQVLSLVF